MHPIPSHKKAQTKKAKPSTINQKMRASYISELREISPIQEQARARVSIFLRSSHLGKSDQIESLDLGGGALLGDRVGGQDVLEGLVGALQVVLDGDGVADAHEDDGEGEEEGAAEDAPVGGEFVHEGGFLAVEGPHHGRAGGLQTLVETGEIGEAAARVAEGAHEPSRGDIRLIV